ncbi:MAG: OsmC family protein, partial [Gemmatimonadaceae bacterium]
AGALEANGTPPTSVDTTASCTVEKDGSGFRVSKMHLDVNAVVLNIEDAKFQEIASATLNGCPVSKALHGNVEMSVDATLGG